MDSAELGMTTSATRGRAKSQYSNPMMAIVDKLVAIVDKLVAIVDKMVVVVRLLTARWSNSAADAWRSSVHDQPARVTTRVNVLDG